MSNVRESVPPQPAHGPRPASRFGPAAVIREGPASGDVQLLSLFAGGDGASRLDRRQSPRVTAVERRAWLGWWANPGEFATAAASLDNISQGGARLFMAGPPPPGQIVWLCLGLPDPTECVQAKILAVTPNPDGDGHPTVRLAFGAPCPLNLYRVAVHGLADRVRPMTERDRRNGPDRATLDTA